MTNAKRNEKMSQHLADKWGIGVRRVPRKEDVVAAKVKFSALKEEATALLKVMGRQRIGQFKKVIRDKKWDIMDLEMERDKLIDEYSKQIMIEKERLSLTYQMHSGPEQTELLQKTKTKIKYGSPPHRLNHFPCCSRYGRGMLACGARRLRECVCLASNHGFAALQALKLWVAGISRAACSTARTFSYRGYRRQRRGMRRWRRARLPWRERQRISNG